MNLFEIIFIGLGLSMAAVAVYMTNGMVYSNMTKDKEASMPIFFGLFQGIMPILEFYAGSLFEELITRYSGIVTLLVLGIIIIIGRKFGDVLGEKAHILGGVILIIIGIKPIL